MEVISSIPLIRKVYKIDLQTGAKPYVKIGVGDVSEILFLNILQKNN